MSEISDLKSENEHSTSYEAAESPEMRGGRLAIFGKRMTIGALLAWVGVLTLLAITAFGLLRSREQPFTIGQSTPDFVLTTFDGEQIDSRDLKGKVMVINFWASWCKPCEEEADDLETAWRYYQPRGD
ncbi:MAG: redoxin domain-containing protein, partial [Anaerolineales bacterium]|nr:redoxin domain-containing protein [Anaerolineales bacterium]